MITPSYHPDETNKLPNDPGVYRFYNADQKLIYVGKAKNLKKRVSSYFTKQQGVGRKTIKMVSEVSKIEITVVNTEFDALLFENNLIKTYQPRYNILLRDDKTYPYICLTNERFPRIFPTRTVNKKAGTFFGPFASVKAMKSILELIKKLFTIRDCRLVLSKSNVESGKFKVCLEYHLGNCKGPCEGLQSETEYLEDIEQAKEIIKGNLSIPKKYFKAQMEKASREFRFETAQEWKDKIDLLEKYQVKSLVVNPKIDNIDVFTITSDDKLAYINYMRIKNGTINLSKTVEVKKQLYEETEQDILTHAILSLRDRYNSESKEIITNVALNYKTEALTFITPKIGDKKKLVELSIKNLLLYKKEKISQTENVPRSFRVLKQLQNDLSLPYLPKHIECFDNSNIQGTNPVASMVYFKDAKPLKKEYRHYHIKTVEGPNDFASMTEVTYRRYKRLIEEGKELPQLIVIDGGKGQLSAAVESLKKLNIYSKVPIIGIAKRLEEIYVPHDPYPLHIDKKSESLRVLQHLRDEAHRFAINFHRNRRSDAFLKSFLDEVSGIGEASIDKLLSHFKSLKKMQEATYEALSQVVGSHKADIIHRALQQKRETE